MKQAILQRIEGVVASGISVAWATSPRNAGLPRVVCWEVGGSFDAVLSGMSGLREQLLQVDVWGRSYGEVASLGDAIYAALAGWVDRDAQIHAVFPTSVRDGDPQAGDVDDQSFRRSFDFRVVYWV